MKYIQEKDFQKHKMKSEMSAEEILNRINALPKEKKDIIEKVLSWLETKNSFPFEFIEIR